MPLLILSDDPLMKVVAEFSFKNGKGFIEKNHNAEFQEVKEVISLVAAARCRTKISKEKTDARERAVFSDCA